ncbi:MAG: TrkA family potassium uptake protein, partial [Sphaerobacter sp.]|nr:TrkA family potassium uptake protein [Sphaerobacter sp.]
MRILIVGCGRLGWRLASEFTKHGHEVAVVDIHAHAFHRLPENFPGKIVIGTGIDEDVLRAAGIERADVFVAVTNRDNTNIMAAQIAQKVYNVPRVVLRIYDPERA